MPDAAILVNGNDNGMGPNQTGNVQITKTKEESV